MTASDTIFALSSGAPPAGVAVVRVSGSGVRALLQDMAGALPLPRRAQLYKLRDSSGGPIDTGLVLFFPGPNSFTGEDVAELQLHGGRATVAAMLHELGGRKRFRIAEAGEFTRRAFLNGRLDLTAVEALSDLIAAETEAQRQFSLSNSSGAQRELYEGWRQRLIKARALIEADLDFSEEEDVSQAASAAFWTDLDLLRGEIETHMAGYQRAEIIREGFDVVILGRPNAGKSTLLNALARRDVAIVSDEAGTTRDLVEVQLDLHGLKVRVTDTAGIREASGRVEQMGIDRAQARASQAHLVVVLDDVGDFSIWSGDPDRVLRVMSKTDRTGAIQCASDIRVSAQTGAGLEDLIGAIRRRAVAAAGEVFSVLPSRARHMSHLGATSDYIRAATEARASGLELSAEALRIASDHLGRLSGKVDVEDLLDIIFSEFCIGK